MIRKMTFINEGGAHFPLNPKIMTKSCEEIMKFTSLCKKTLHSPHYHSLLAYKVTLNGVKK